MHLQVRCVKDLVQALTEILAVTGCSNLLHGVSLSLENCGDQSVLDS